MSDEGLQRALAGLERLELVLGGTAHALANRLGVARNYAFFAQGAAGEQEALAADLAEVVRAVEQAIELVARLAPFCPPSTGDGVGVDLTTGLTDLVPRLTRLLGPGVALVLSVRCDAARVRLSGAGLALVLEQLLLNACASGAGSVQVALTAAGPSVVALDVTDDGEGMGAQELADATQPFRSRTPGAAGLGLPAVLCAVERAGGQVTLATVPGSGTTVTVHLPLCDSAAA